MRTVWDIAVLSNFWYEFSDSLRRSLESSALFYGAVWNKLAQSINLIVIVSSVIVINNSLKRSEDFVERVNLIDKLFGLIIRYYLKWCFWSLQFLLGICFLIVLNTVWVFNNSRFYFWDFSFIFKFFNIYAPLRF